MRNTKLKITSLILLAGVISCEYTPQRLDIAPGGVPDSKAQSRSSVTTRDNEIARFLAGLPLQQGSEFEKLTQSPSYKQHAAWMEKFWARVRTESSAPIIPWRRDNIPQSLQNNVAMYPLSGADFINLYTFFPAARSYVMFALEDPGRVPEISTMTENDLRIGLSSMQRVINSIGAYNYFFSASMMTEMINKQMPGTLPVLLAFSAGLGLEVVEARSVCLDEHGDIQALDVNGTFAGKKPAITGAKISFLSKEDRTPRDLFYFKIRLRKDAVAETTPEGRFLRKYNHVNTMLKSAVYLLHDQSYQPVSAFLLDRSDLVIQDDSGIPLRAFDAHSWNLKHYGTFVRALPVGGIPNPPQQPDLASHYAKNKPEPLPFPYGYGILRGKNRSNLMLFTRGDNKGTVPGPRVSMLDTDASLAAVSR